MKKSPKQTAKIYWKMGERMWREGLQLIDQSTHKKGFEAWYLYNKGKALVYEANDLTMQGNTLFSKGS